MYVLAVANLQHYFLDGQNARYANIIVYYIDPSHHSRATLLHQFANTLQTLHVLERAGLPLEHCKFLERLFFCSLPSELVRWLQKMSHKLFMGLCARIACDVWAPDHLWRTGTFAGRTTLQAMNDQWIAHHSGETI